MTAYTGMKKIQSQAGILDGNTHQHRVIDHLFNCLQPERTIAIRKRKFLNKFSVIHNALCRVFIANAKTELESCCTDV